MIYCDNCNYLFSLKKTINYCRCKRKKCAGKYLDDSLTAVVTKNSTLIGVDNNTFHDSVRKCYRWNESRPEQRMDFFFTGWTCTKPGETIMVDTAWRVKRFNPRFEADNKTSTLPTISGNNDD